MNHHNIKIQQIEYFLAVAKYLNFTDAAKNLYISQPSLSKQIALFEESINAQLFIRNKRTVSLTPAGLLLKDKLGDILKDIDLAIESARFVDEGYKSKLKIACLGGLDTNNFLLRIAEYFKSKYPDILINCEIHSFMDLRNLLFSDNLDLVITFSFEVENIDGVNYSEIWKTNSSILISKDNTKANEKTLKMADLIDEPFVMISRDISPNAFDTIVSLCHQSGFAPKIAKFVPNVESLILCVESNMGVAMLDASTELQSKSNVVNIPLLDTCVSVVAAWKIKNKNPALKLFLDMFVVI